MRVVKLKTLKEFWEDHADSKGALEVWYRVVKQGKWTCFNDIKKVFRSVDVLQGNRAVFNIKGNTYRLVVLIDYEFHVIFIRFIGTHKQYDKINA